ncbi:unnamed protein product [Mytilus coruscus]|uniref:LRRNT domain-containing protein n=1 Tax=Mytilus coruscus TaxID=42192 RepID=A0A6J8A5N4_MYTCO|nr:unnamed protein product [Mytilus coruscus]
MHRASQLLDSSNILFQYGALQLTASVAHVDNNFAVPQLTSPSPHEIFLQVSSCDHLATFIHIYQGKRGTRKHLIKWDLVNGCPSSCSCTVTTVDCSKRSLTEIPANIPSNTTILRLDENFITTVGSNVLSGLTSLTELNLAINRISSIDADAFSDLKEVRSMDLSYDKLVSLPQSLLSTNTKLDTLSLMRNQLESLPEGLLTFNTNLQYLDLSFNKLVSLPQSLLSTNTKLDTLYLTRNQLESLPEGLLTFNTNLQYLYLSNNQIERLPEDLLTLNTILLELYLYGNNLVSLPEGLLSSNTILTRLDIRRNPLICCLMIEFKEWASNQLQLQYQGTCTILNKTININDFNTTDCIIPVDGGWSPWFNSSCSVSCGEGVKIQSRTCDNPPPSGGGLPCVGSETETSLCNLGKCPESCSHSKKGSDNKPEDDLDNKAGTFPP